MPGQLILPNASTRNLSREVINAQLKEGDVLFAGGTLANNHLDLGYEEVAPRLRAKIAARYGNLEAQLGFVPDFRAYVPSGGDGWDAEINPEASSLHRPPLFFKKLGRRVFEALPETEDKIAELKNKLFCPTGLVIDDASHDGGTAEALADHIVDEYDIEVRFITALFFRGEPKQLEKSKYGRAAIMAREIPPQLDWESFRKTHRLRPAKISSSCGH